MPAEAAITQPIAQPLYRRVSRSPSHDKRRQRGDGRLQAHQHAERLAGRGGAGRPSPASRAGRWSSPPPRARPLGSRGRTVPSPPRQARRAPPPGHRRQHPERHRLTAIGPAGTLAEQDVERPGQAAPRAKAMPTGSSPPSAMPSGSSRAEPRTATPIHRRRSARRREAIEGDRERPGELDRHRRPQGQPAEGEIEQQVHQPRAPRRRARSNRPPGVLSGLRRHGRQISAEKPGSVGPARDRVLAKVAPTGAQGRGRRPHRSAGQTWAILANGRPALPSGDHRRRRKDGNAADSTADGSTRPAPLTIRRKSRIRAVEVPELTR